MFVNADFSCRAVVAPDQYRWVASPQSGIERVMLDRLGGEKARATSIVRYAPDSHFPRHLHPGGEEIFVLSSSLCDEDGYYPAGWYLRNLPSTWHLGEPKDASELSDPPASIHNPYADGVRALKAALRPGEKIFPYSGFVSYNGQAGGTSGYAIIRNGCVVKKLIIEAI